MFLYDCMPSLSQLLYNENLLKNVSQLGMGNNPTTPVYTTKRENLFDEQKTTKNVKITNDLMLINVMEALTLLIF